MTLEEYLTAEGETQVAFGRRMGVRQQVISRWASGWRIPRPHFMAAVERLTDRKVLPADFYFAHAARVAAAEAGAQAGEQAFQTTRDAALARGASRAAAKREAEAARMQAAYAAEDIAYREHLKRAREEHRAHHAQAEAARVAHGPAARAA